MWEPKIPEEISGNATVSHLYSFAREGGAVAGNQPLALSTLTAQPARTDCVNDIFAGQLVALHDFCAPAFAAVERFTFCQQLRSCSAMNAAVHTAATQQRLIGSVDDGVNLHFCDVISDDNEAALFYPPSYQSGIGVRAIRMTARIAPTNAAAPMAANSFLLSFFFVALQISAAQAMQTAAATSVIPSVSHSQENAKARLLRKSRAVGLLAVTAPVVSTGRRCRRRSRRCCRRFPGRGLPPAESGAGWRRRRRTAPHLPGPGR